MTNTFRVGFPPQLDNVGYGTSAHQSYRTVSHKHMITTSVRPRTRLDTLKECEKAK